MENSSSLSILTIKVLKFMGECGARYPLDNFENIYMYVYRMLQDNRVVEIGKNGTTEGYLFYSLCHDINSYYKKKTWRYVPQVTNGTTLYVEKLVCKKWTKELRRKFEEIITTMYPQIEGAIWHRYGLKMDRKVIYRRNLCMK